MWMPSMRGIAMSVTTRSGLHASAARNPDSPSTAMATVAPASSSTIENSSRASRSSSTMRMSRCDEGMYRLDHSTVAAQQTDKEQHDGNDEQQMDERANRVRADHAEKPRDEQDDRECVQH